MNRGVSRVYLIDEPATAKRSLRRVLPRVISVADWQPPPRHTANVAVHDAFWEGCGASSPDRRGRHDGRDRGAHPRMPSQPN